MSTRCLSAQEDPIEQIQPAQGIVGEMLHVSAVFDHSMPVSLCLTKQEDCSGILHFDTGVQIKLEGRCTDETISLLEFDQDTRVVSKLKGVRRDNNYDLKWQIGTSDKVYTIKGMLSDGLTGNIRMYKTVNGDHVLIWKDRQLMQGSMVKDHSPIRWSSYSCHGGLYACQTSHGQHLSISDKTVVIDGQKLELSDHLKISQDAKFADGYYYNYNVPVLGERTFDAFMSRATSLVKDEMTKVEGAEERLSAKGQGDVMITLLSPELISGYLYDQSDAQLRVRTTPFIYDRKSKDFLTVKDLWRDDFNFVFYINSLIESKKRKLLQKEESLVRSVLKDQNFSHLAISPEGLLLFTDYHALFGRRYILIPYEEVRSFVDHKTLSRYIEKTLAS